MPPRKTYESWSKPETIFLISQLKKHPELYKIMKPGYQIMRKRQIALNEIHQEMQSVREGISLLSIKSKLRKLRNQVTYEKRRSLDRKCSDGAVLDDPKKPKLWCFKELQFLFDAIDCNSKSTTDDVQLLSENALNNDSVEDSEAEPTSNDIKKKECSSNTEASANLVEVQAQPFDCPAEIRQVKTDTSLSTWQDVVSTNRSERLQHDAQQIANLSKVFCNYLCTELQQLQCIDVFENGKIELLKLVAQLKKEDRIMQSRNQTPVTSSLAISNHKINFLDRALHEYEQRAHFLQKIQSTDENLMLIAAKICDILKIDYFQPNSKWLQEWKTRYNLNRKMSTHPGPPQLMSLDIRDILSYCSRQDKNRNQPMPTIQLAPKEKNEVVLVSKQFKLPSTQNFVETHIINDDDDGYGNSNDNLSADSEVIELDDFDEDDYNSLPMEEFVSI